MRANLGQYGLAVGPLVFFLSVAGANASPYAPVTPRVSGVPFGVDPIAMCGYSCERGGRFIPGPPSVCFERGLDYCGRPGGENRTRRSDRYGDEDDEGSTYRGSRGSRGYDRDEYGGRSYDRRGSRPDYDPRDTRGQQERLQAEQQRDQAEQSRRADEDRRRMEEERRRAEEARRRR